MFVVVISILIMLGFVAVIYRQQAKTEQSVAKDFGDVKGGKNVILTSNQDTYDNLEALNASENNKMDF